MKHKNPECSEIEIGSGNCQKCNPDKNLKNMKNDKKLKFIRDEINRILEIDYYSPHAPASNTVWDKPRCGDCFCTDQSVHTHATMSYLKKAEDLISFVKRELNK